MLTLKAYAKVNLVLEVLGKREDGYHEIVSVMQTIGLHDVLTLEADDEISFSCSVAGLQTDDNLVLRAVHALRQATGVKMGARITLEKEIPAAAGLGGGSSDAAAALKGLNRLWGLGLATEKLAEIGAGIGSDVPYFLYGGTCLAEGRGEKVTHLPEVTGAWFVLLKPNIKVPVKKTAALYGILNPGHYSSGGWAARAVELLKAGKRMAGTFYNTFDSVSATVYKGLERYRQAMDDAGAVRVYMSGSGPLLFSVFDNRKAARFVQQKLLRLKMDAIVAPCVTRDEAEN